LTFSCALANGHIMLNTPVLVRSLKLSNIEPSQYLDGWPPGNTGCCWLQFFLQSFLFYGRFDEKMVKYMYFRYIFFLSSFIFPGDFLLKCLDLKEKIQKSKKIKKSKFPFCFLFFFWYFWFFHRKKYGSLQKIQKTM
jgi:hypothetical protein